MSTTVLVITLSKILNFILQLFFSNFPRVKWGVILFYNDKREVVTAAAAKSLQSCPTLCNPIDGSPPGSPVPGILQARTLELVAFFSNA